MKNVFIAMLLAVVVLLTGCDESPADENVKNAISINVKQIADNWYLLDTVTRTNEYTIVEGTEAWVYVEYVATASKNHNREVRGYLEHVTFENLSEGVEITGTVAMVKRGNTWYARKQ